MKSLTLLVQVIMDLFFMVSVVVLWIQFRRPKNEDPRLTAGLQELQNKIAVLEDLGDRTEKQVQQLMTILENKLIDVQKKIDQADNVQGKMSKSMEKSLEVVKIFQDKIPHEEIRERQNTLKFVRAAILANQGFSIQEIAEQVDLPYGELEFIAKVNKNELSFDESQLPDWIQTELKEMKFAIKDDLQFLESPLQQPQKVKTNAGMTSADQDALQIMGEKFRQAQILVSQRRAIEPQQTVLDVQTAELCKESEQLQQESAFSAQQLQQEPLSAVQQVLQAQHGMVGGSGTTLKSAVPPRKIVQTVQRLIDQKKQELGIQQAGNFGQIRSSASDKSSTQQPSSVYSSSSQGVRESQSEGLQKTQSQSQIYPSSAIFPSIKPMQSIQSSVAAKPSSLARASSAAAVIKPSSFQQSSLSKQVSSKSLGIVRQDVVRKSEPPRFAQESKILKKGKDLGIRPVVFPRIEAPRK